MFNFRKFISVSAIAMLGVTNLLTPLSYANAADVGNYDTAGNPIWTGRSFSFIMPAHDVFLYAMTEPNNYTVTYKPGQGSGTEFSSGYVYDTTGDLHSRGDFERLGHTFSGWNHSGTSYTETAHAVYNWTTELDGNVDATAEWTANKYKIHYDLNKGTGTSTPTSGVRQPEDATYGVEFDVDAPQREGYTFSGWDISEMDTNPHIIGEDTTSEENVSTKATSFNNLHASSGAIVQFLAQWTADNIKYRVTHSLQDLEDLTKYDIQSGATTEPEGPADSIQTPATGTFTGFEPAEGTPYSSGIGTTDFAQVFEYRYNRLSYTLILEAGTGVESATASGTVTTPPLTVNENGSGSKNFKYDEPLTFTYKLKDGYTGATWDQTPPANMPAELTGRKVTATVIEYEIDYNLNGGQEITGQENPRSYTVETPAFTLNDLTGKNSDFLGWTGTNIVGTSEDVQIGPEFTGDRSFTAQWKCHTGYHANGSTDTGYINYGDCIANSETPFTIEYYEKNLTGEYVLYNTGLDHGYTDSGTNVVPADRDGFTTQQVTQQNINGDGSTIVKVYYDRNSYDEHINDPTGIHTTANGANDSYVASDKHHQYGDVVTLSYTEESGYTFDYWTIEGSGLNQTITSGDANKTFVMPASDVTITSHAIVNEYTLTIEKHGATDGATGRNYTVEDTVTLVNPTRDHSHFDGWSGTDLDGLSTSVSFSGRAYDSTYEAIWSCVTGYHENGTEECVANGYTVEINYNDSDKPGTGIVNATYDSGFDVDTPQKSGYHFAGWTVTGISGGNATVDGSGVSDGTLNTSGTTFKNLTTQSGGKVTFEANWIADEDTKYKVFYYTQNVENDNYTLVDSGVHQGTSDTKVAVSELAYAITGYNTPTEGYLEGGINGHSGTAYTQITIDRHGTTEIYLFYTRGTFHVYLSGDAHVTGLSGSGDYRYGDTVNVEATVATGYHFKEWRRKANSGFVQDL